MKPAKLPQWLLSLFAILTLVSGCDEICNSTQTFVVYRPVYEQMETFRVSVLSAEPREIGSPGRIYFKDGFLLINEPGEGFHVIDNRNQYNPVTISFVEVPGNFDLAAQGNYLYADSFIDLLVFDISDMSNIQLIERQEDIFLQSYIENGSYVENSGILTHYDEETVKEQVDCETRRPRGGWCLGCVSFAAADAPGMAEFSTSNSSTGTGGSMARFTISKGHLFTLDNSSLRSFSLADESSPSFLSHTYVGWGMETIFPYDDYLYLGANSGMTIVDIANPEQPTEISTYSHATACDPVVVQGNYAYVTLRSGNRCEGFRNQLDVLDISNPWNPQLINSVEMDNPHGLGIDGSCLFICEGEHGIKFFDASDVMEIENNLTFHHRNVHALDVIPLNNNLMMIGNDGLYQYHYACGDTEIELMSTIAINGDL